MSVSEAKKFLIFLLAVFFVLLVVILSGFFAPLVLGLLLMGLSFPLYEVLLKRLGGKENLAALTAVLIISLVIILPFLGLLSLLTKEAVDLLGTAPDKFSLGEAIVRTLEPLAQKFNLDVRGAVRAQLTPVLEKLGLVISREIGNLLSNAARLVLNFFVMFVSLFYLLRDGRRLGEFLMSFSPLANHEEMDLYHTFKEAGRAIFYSNFVSAIVQGILGGIGFALFGLGSPVLWGAVMAFLALIPLLGAYIIFIPAALYLFFTGKTAIAIGFLLYNILIVSSVDNLIKPKLISQKIKIHPLLILLAILGGLKIFGLMGIVYGPLIIAIFLTLLKVYLEHVRLEEIKTDSH